MGDENVRDLKRALRESPDDRVGWLRLSVALERAGRPGSSAEAARRAAECDPLDPVVRARLHALGLARGPWPDAEGGAHGARRSPLAGARKGEVAFTIPLPGARGVVVVGPDGTAWVRAGAKLAEIGFRSSKPREGAPRHAKTPSPTESDPGDAPGDGDIRRFDDWSPQVNPVVGVGGGLVASCREDGPLVADPRTGFPHGRRPRRDTLEEATLDGRGERLWSAWRGSLRALPLAHVAGLVASATIPLFIRKEEYLSPRPAFAPDGTIYVAEADRRKGLVRAFGPDGREKWSVAVDRAAQGAAGIAVAPSGTLAVRVGDTVRGLDPRTGSERWNFRTHVPNYWRMPADGLPAPAIGPNGVAFVATSWGLKALDVDTGLEVFSRNDLPTPIPIAVDAGGVAHVAMPGRLVGVGPKGETVYEVGLPTRGGPPDPPSIGYGGTTFVVGVDEVLAII